MNKCIGKITEVEDIGGGALGVSIKERKGKNILNKTNISWNINLSYWTVEAKISIVAIPISQEYTVVDLALSYLADI